MKSLFIVSLTLLSICLSAQTQQGYVRTIGRAGKPGQPVSGVTIRAEGPYNAVLSDADGKFSLVFSGFKEGDSLTGWGCHHSFLMPNRLLFME